jgi:hypothetical protein
MPRVKSSDCSKCLMFKISGLYYELFYEGKDMLQFATYREIVPYKRNLRTLTKAKLVRIVVLYHRQQSLQSYITIEKHLKYRPLVSFRVCGS